MQAVRFRSMTVLLVLAALFLALGITGYALTRPPDAVSQNGAVSRGALPRWKPLALTNGWVNGGFDSYTAAYYKDAQQVVHLRGSAYGGVWSDAVFRLPSGNRPAHTLWLSIYAFGGSAGGMEIRPNGYAYVFDNVGGGDAQRYSSFDGVSFRVP